MRPLSAVRVREESGGASGGGVSEAGRRLVRRVELRDLCAVLVSGVLSGMLGVLAFRPLAVAAAALWDVLGAPRPQ